MKRALFSVLMIIFVMVGTTPADHQDWNGQSLESHWSKNDPFGHNIPGNLKTDRRQDIRHQRAAGTALCYVRWLESFSLIRGQ